MPSPPPEQVSNATVLRLAEGVESVGKRLAQVKKDSEARDAKLDKYARRSRLYIALDVLLTVVSIVATIVALSALGSADSANSRANSAEARAAALSAAEQVSHAEQVSGCVSGNQYRAGVVSSLDRLVVLLEGPHPSPVIQKAAVGYEQYVLSKNEPRDCVKAYAVKPPQSKETGSAK